MSANPDKRASFGMLLRRSKSGELKGKKAQALREQGLQRQRDAAIPKSPPRLPVLYNGAPAPNLTGSFGDPGRENGATSPTPTDYYNSNYTPRQSMEPSRPSMSMSSRPSMSMSSRPSMSMSMSVNMSVPVPPVPATAWVDPYARSESMTHRGRYSYASSAVSTINNPRRVRRRKDPTPFNILIVGTRNSGKTSFLEFLKTALALPAKKRGKPFDANGFVPPAPASGNFVPHFLETDIDGERVGVTLWDSEGLEKNVVDLQLREMLAFLESKFEDTFNEEMKVVRSPGVQDTHIHAVFLILDPARLDRNIAASKQEGAANGSAATRNGGPVQYVPQPRVLGGLDEDLDLQVLRTLQGKTTVIPVISKADTITTKHMNVLKKAVSDSLKKASLDPLEVLGLDELDDESSDSSNRIDEESDEDTAAATETGAAETGAEAGAAKAMAQAEAGTNGTSADESLPIQGHVRDSYSRASQSSKSSRQVSAASGRGTAEDEVPFIPMSIISPDIYEPGVVGRQFPWGFADPNNEEHCDFGRLKDAVFSEWRGELREASREQWYEGWRTSRLKQRDGGRVRGSVRR